MTTCGHARLSIFDAAQELQRGHITDIEHGGEGINIEPFIRGTDGEDNLDFAGAVARATKEVVVDSCELCDGVVNRFCDGFRCFTLVSKNGATIPLMLIVSGPREDERWSEEDRQAFENVRLDRGLNQGLLESLQR